MNEEQQRTAIAEACGWVKTVASGVWAFYVTNEKTKFARFDELPDYLNDLNAIWLAVRKELTGAEQLRTYESHLHNLSPDYPTETTAAQRAEAYLRTIGKWEGGADES